MGDEKTWSVPDFGGVLSKVFLDYDQKALDDQYEQRVWVPHADEIIKRYAAASDAVRKRLGEPRVERYGPTPPETLDIYGSGKKAFVFVHGGAWRRQSSREQAFPAEPIIAAGATYVALNFANLPSVTLPEMAAQVCRGIQWVHENLSRDLVLFGHSSGGHLAENENHPDLADRASSETDRAIELRARDRQRKLISKINSALSRIEDGSYGYCEETGEPISLKRLDARPIATLSLEAQERHERRERVYRDD